jgi:hypothetical protein
MIIKFEGDDAMFGDAEHYKYLTNEADLNNAADDSIALTPKTPKKVCCFLLLFYVYLLEREINLNEENNNNNKNIQ